MPLQLLQPGGGSCTSNVTGRFGEIKIGGDIKGKFLGTYAFMMNRSAFAFFLCAAGLRAAPIFDPSEAAVLDQQGANGTVVAAPLFDPSKVAVLDEQGANGTVVADFFRKRRRRRSQMVQPARTMTIV